MYNYKERTSLSSKSEKPAAHHKCFGSGRPAQFKFADRQIHGKLVQCFRADSIIQLARGRIIKGAGNEWHIHDVGRQRHIKYGSNNGTRVNFNGRTSESILDALEEKLRQYPGLRDKPYLDECIAWIRENC